MGVKDSYLSRRDFLTHTALGIIGVGIGMEGFRGLQLAHGDDNKLSTPARSKVISVKKGGIIRDGKPDQKTVQRMIDEGMFTLTGKKTIADAWRCFFTSDDVVGIKINPIGGKKLSTRPEIVNAIIPSLLAAGVKENNIIVWDRFENHLTFAGYQLNKGNSGVRYYGTEQTAGYDKEIYYESEDDDPVLREQDGTRSLFSTIITQQVTAIINVPVMKSHDITGITLCLKNIAFGVINNTARFHPSPYFCNPSTSEVYTHPAMKDKVRLHIADALQACFDGGPVNMKPQTIWNEERLFFGTDPVAIDRIGLEIIDKKRKENNCASVFQKAKHIATAEKKGLGVFDKNNIELIELNV
ncbi:MAG: DUF362 domain-containing protein [Candidatus Jettenia caeni]|nr:DUF362 domain-containing protein [Candidatus Jettenia caeni]UJS16771.1 MAG: DUF362 domain-containing protein [Candidatus Jettenia sp.]